MANFISNSFQLPNDLIDKGYMATMKGAALPCYLFIVRKTRGWGKTTDSISVSQFVKETGYNKDTVLKGLNRLEEMGVIRRITSSTHITRYTLTDNIIVENTSNSQSNGGENSNKNLSNNSHSEKLDSEKLDKPLDENLDKLGGQLGENLDKLDEKLDKHLSKNSPHNNNIKTTNKKTNIISAEKSKKPQPSNEKFSFVAELKKLGADHQLIQDWLTIRKSKKAPNTQTAFDGFVREYKKSGLDLNTVLRVCIEQNWKGFNASWNWQAAVASLQAQQPHHAEQQAYGDQQPHSDQHQPSLMDRFKIETVYGQAFGGVQS